MLVEVRPVGRLSGKKPVDLAAALGPVVDGLVEDGIDLSGVRVVCDWLQYKNNFREVVDARAIMTAPAGGLGPVVRCAPGVESDVDGVEVAVDLRRAPDADLRGLTADALRRHRASLAGEPPGVALEDWCAGSDSCIWDFNGLYWRALDRWEKATGRAYEQALPGGESDARNLEGVREIIGGLLDGWDVLAARRALPDELYVLELGVGNGNQAKVWLDEFRRMDAERGTEHYRRLHYLMCDYSPYVLDMARETVAGHRDRVSSFVLDATRPLAALSFLQYKVFLVYISNVYDNLPTDEVARLGGRTYLTEVRAYLPRDAAERLAASVPVEPGELPAMLRKLLLLGPELASEAMPERLADPEAAVEFWRQAWADLRLQERYVPIGGLDQYRIAPDVDGEMLRPFLESGQDIRLHVNNGTVASFVDTLRLLHPYGKLISHDLFVTDVGAYRTAFRGPGKYEGSVVCWINGPLLAHIGRRMGYDVRYAPFAHRTGTNIVTLTAQARD
jgi:hypothetical protein